MPIPPTVDVITHSQWKHHTLREIPEDEKDALYIALRGDEPDTARQRIAVNRLTAARLDVLTFHMLAPSFAYLTVLELRNAHPIQIPRMAYTKIFSSAPRLVNVSFMRCYALDEDWTGEFDGDEDEELVMQAPCLEVLRVFASDMGMYMWKHLNAPKLKDLVLADIDIARALMWVKDAWEDDFDHAQVQTDFPCLERLVLYKCHGEPLSDPQLLLFCRLTSSIRHLVLNHDFYTGILSQMLRLGPDPLLWPNLQVLRLDQSACTPEDNGNWGGFLGGVDGLPNLLQRRRDIFGIECIVEVGREVISALSYADNEEATLQVSSFVERGLARIDPINADLREAPVWPPPTGSERPEDVSDLWHVDMLGAISNPWYDGLD